MNKKPLIVVALTMGIVMLASIVLAGTPFRKVVTMTTGSGSLTYSNGIANQAFSAFVVKGLVLGSAAGSTATVSVTSGNVTNQLGTKSVSATDKTYLVTNDTWHFIGDKVMVSSTDTNAHTYYVIGEEE